MKELKRLNMAFIRLMQRQPATLIIGLLCSVIVRYNEAVDLGKFFSSFLLLYLEGVGLRLRG